MVANIAATLAMGRAKFSPLGVLVPGPAKEAFAGTHQPLPPSTTPRYTATPMTARGGEYDAYAARPQTTPDRVMG